MPKKYNYTKKTGRPSKFPSINLIQLKKLVLAGLDDNAISDFFGFTKQTFCNFKNKYPEFFDSLKEWKKTADERVERSLYERASGYTFPTEEIFNYQGKVIRAKSLKHVPPDVTAQIFWLKNRQPDKWRDKHDHEHSGEIVIDLKSLVEQAGKISTNRISKVSQN